MKRKISVILTAWLACGGLAVAASADESPVKLAQVSTPPDLFDDEIDDKADDAEALEKQARKEAKRKAAEEEKRAAEAKRQAVKQSLKERQRREAELKELDVMRETTTEYTVDPGSVEMVVELDPNNYGFRQRNHRMILGTDFDLLLRGRGMLSYDYRFFEYWSFAIKAGVDWSDVSLYSRFRDQLNKPAPKQFSILGGLSAKWRLTEWYMRTSVFLEPSFVAGYMWQTLISQDSNHWRLRPGLFAGLETVFDSGLSMSFRLGFEAPFDFGQPNPIKETVEPLALFGLGFAI